MNCPRCGIETPISEAKTELNKALGKSGYLTCANGHKFVHRPVSVGGKALLRAGFIVVREVHLKWNPWYRYDWFECVAPNGYEVLILRQGPHAWHAFGREASTYSGTSPKNVLEGGLGDAIGTDSQMRTYCRKVLAAPDRLAQEYQGLYAAQSQCWNERNSDR